ncbi:MAG: DUF2207 domain-containing protein [Coriobacteriia bacterium]|nr:DUF2207 domain-containing protein [Coriobacteriia bacterium]
MQNTSRAQHRDVLIGLVVSIVLVATMTLMAAAPVQAQAKEYEMSRVDINAQVTDAGNLNVQESRQFDFDGSFTCVWWNFDALPANATLRVNKVSYRQASSNEVQDAKAHEVGEVAFETPWRSAGGPGGEAWSWDELQDTLYAFFEASDESLVVTIDYTVVNAVTAYKDVGELYWKYLGDGWGEDSKNVTARISLPVPAGESVVPTENAYAWGHGPINGSVHFADDGTVNYSVDRVRSGQFAEARVCFPTEWLTNVDASLRAQHANEERLPSVLSEEQGWADSANAERTQSLIFLAVCFGVPALLIIWAIVMFFRYGKERKPRFADQYWRDVPDADLPPAVIGRLMEWNNEKPSQFTATLMGLSAKGVVRIDKGSYEGRRGKMVEDYYLTLLPEMLDLVEIDDLERKAINIVFGDIAKGENQLWMKSIELYGKNNPEAFASKMQSWQGKLTSEVNKAKLFEPKSDSLQGTMRLVAAGYFVLGIAGWWMTDNAWPLIPVIPTMLILFAIAHFMSKRTQRGADVAAKADSLKKWLKDFTRLEERPPTDVKVWGQFMVYAFLFGIADQVVKDMRMSVPAFRDMDDATFYTTMPYYYWYSSDLGHRNVIAASVFDATVSNTLNSAVAAVSEMADGGGGGGGFSSGGGGGFGGGGGGAR